MLNLPLLDAFLLFQAAGVFVYVLFLLAVSIGLRRLKKDIKTTDETPFVSVIVAARNEEKNIADCLNHLLEQSYAKENYEIILVDDHSEDDTLTIARMFASQHSRVKLFSLGDYDGISPKKAALQLGISHARGEIILTTDADCRVQKDWIRLLVSHFDAGTGAVASWLIVEANEHFVSRLEVLDSAALVLVGASAFGLGRPFVANGANFGYRKKVYEELNGFDGVETWVSGDDDLFLHKIIKSGRWRCRFVDDQNAAVFTNANDSLSGFFAQRFRWASKGGVYPVGLVAFEVLIYAFYAALFFSLIVFPLSRMVLIVPFLLKLTLDFLFLKDKVYRFGLKFNAILLLCAELLQIVYVLIVGVWGLIGSYTWKGRAYTRGRIKGVEK